MIITLFVHNIQWDIDEDCSTEEAESLPSQLEVKVDLKDQNGWTEINHQICNQLSDETGWCVLGYQLKGHETPSEVGQG